MGGVWAEVYRRRRSMRRPPTWAWRIVASNGEIVATDGGQGFTERNDAKEAVEHLALSLSGGSIRVQYV